MNWKLSSSRWLREPRCLQLRPSRRPRKPAETAAKVRQEGETAQRSSSVSRDSFTAPTARHGSTAAAPRTPSLRWSQSSARPIATSQWRGPRDAEAGMAASRLATEVPGPRSRPRSDGQSSTAASGSDTSPGRSRDGPPSSSVCRPTRDTGSDRRLHTGIGRVGEIGEAVSGRVGQIRRQRS